MNYKILIISLLSLLVSCGGGVSNDTVKTLPETPSNITVTPSVFSLYLSWNNVTSATTYNIYYKKSKNVSTDDIKLISNTNSITIEGLDSNSNYYIVVSANSSDGNSALSVEVETKTLNEETKTNVLKGRFIPLIQGLSYSTSSLEGLTSNDGEFNYVESENITFKVGGVVLAEIQAKSIITLLDLTGTNQTPLFNIAGLLLSMDNDRDSSNGLQISESTTSRLTNQKIDFNSEFFVIDAFSLLGEGDGYGYLLPDPLVKTYVIKLFDELEVSNDEIKSQLYSDLKLIFVENDESDIGVIGFREDNSGFVVYQKIIDGVLTVDSISFVLPDGTKEELVIYDDSSFCYSGTTECLSISSKSSVKLNKQHQLLSQEINRISEKNDYTGMELRFDLFNKFLRLLLEENTEGFAFLRKNVNELISDLSDLTYYDDKEFRTIITTPLYDTLKANAVKIINSAKETLGYPKKSLLVDDTPHENLIDEDMVFVKEVDESYYSLAEFKEKISLGEINVADVPCEQSYFSYLRTECPQYLENPVVEPPQIKNKVLLCSKDFRSSGGILSLVEEMCVADSSECALLGGDSYYEPHDTEESCSQACQVHATKPNDIFFVSEDENGENTSYAQNVCLTGESVFNQASSIEPLSAKQACLLGKEDACEEQEEADVISITGIKDITIDATNMVDNLELDELAYDSVVFELDLSPFLTSNESIDSFESDDISVVDAIFRNGNESKIYYTYTMNIHAAVTGGLLFPPDYKNRHTGGAVFELKYKKINKTTDIITSSSVLVNINISHINIIMEKNNNDYSDNMFKYSIPMKQMVLNDITYLVTDGRATFIGPTLIETLEPEESDVSDKYISDFVDGHLTYQEYYNYRSKCVLSEYTYIPQHINDISYLNFGTITKILQESYYNSDDSTPEARCKLAGELDYNNKTRTLYFYGDQQYYYRSEQKLDYYKVCVKTYSDKFLTKEVSEVCSL